MQKILLLLPIFCANFSFAQMGQWPNGTASKDASIYALTDIVLYQDADTRLEHATLVWKNGKVLASGVKVDIPNNAVIIPGNGAIVYPGFIDMYAPEAGIEFSKTPEVKTSGYTSNQTTIRATNDAMRADYRSVLQYVGATGSVDDFRKNGFTTIQAFHADGVVRGTSVIAQLGIDEKHKNILKQDASMMFSFSKGSSTMHYPSSLVGSVALMRQSLYDAQCYEKIGSKLETNLGLEALVQYKSLPKILETTDKWDAILGNEIAKEFKFSFIYKGSGNEYQRMQEIKALKSPFILPLNFPEAYDVKDADLAQGVWYSSLMHWDLAPFNALYFYKNEVPFVFTLSDLKSKGDANAAFKTVYETGLPKNEILRAITYTPAKMLGIESEHGHLKSGAVANFVVSKAEIASEQFSVLATIVSGKVVYLKSWPSNDISGKYSLFPNASNEVIFTVESKGNSYKVKADSAIIKVEFEREKLAIEMAYKKDSTKWYTLQGKVDQDKSWLGSGKTPDGTSILWSAKRISDIHQPKDEIKNNSDSLPVLVYPFTAFGRKEIIQQEEIIFKNVNVWSNTSDGIMTDMDVWVKNGKIAKIGKGFSSKSARLIDGKNLHLTNGMIDEHSHIALRKGVNEGGANISAECRMSDAINPEDINIYRHISGGVTLVQQLHGSANPIGGQSSIIKLKWGANASDLLVKDADGFIKFALGENVKQSNWGNGRYPQSRSGVEQTFEFWFTRALEYEKNKEGRVDIRLETLLEILKSKRFITCHSYVQSEINMLMKLAEKYNFKINTFTHILEGYKLADKMKDHGVAASTFADWWAYKMEVNDAIPYNASIMSNVGVLTAINSDDAEMGRRLNHEAAKLVKYGNLSEEEAWKTVTLNPAKMLHLDSKLGSIEVGKDADLVLWSHNPLSVYAKVEYTLIDGAIYFNRSEQLALKKEMDDNRKRIIEKMKNAPEVKSGKAKPPVKMKEHFYHCEDIGGHDHE